MKTYEGALDEAAFDNACIYKAHHFSVYQAIPYVYR